MQRNLNLFVATNCICVLHFPLDLHYVKQEAIEICKIKERDATNHRIHFECREMVQSICCPRFVFCQQIALGFCQWMLTENQKRHSGGSP